MYVEGDARIDTFQNQQGENVTRLNITQRKDSSYSYRYYHRTDGYTGHFEALSRPRATLEDSETSAAESPDSGLGQS